jgi:hypothetical protein
MGSELRSAGDSSELPERRENDRPQGPADSAQFADRVSRAERASWVVRSDWWNEPDDDGWAASSDDGQADEAAAAASADEPAATAPAEAREAAPVVGEHAADGPAEAPITEPEASREPEEPAEPEHGSKAVGDAAGGRVAVRGEVPLSSSADHPKPADALDRDDGPDRLYADGKEYGLTGNPRDGIWISGLPGEAPGTPEGDPYGTIEVGDVLVGDEPGKSKFDKFADALYENVDELSDRLESLGEKVQKVPGSRAPAGIPRRGS